MKLDKKALVVIENDNSKGSDKLFLKKLKNIITGNTIRKAA